MEHHREGSAPASCAAGLFFQHSQIYYIDDLELFVKTDPEQVYQCFLDENHRIDDTNA